MASAMEFWGVEVKGKEPCEVALEQGFVIHVSQITLGDMKKDKETVTVHVNFGEKKFVMGFLSQETPQLSCDLVFDSDFEISHSWKNGTIHLMGYQAEMGAPDPGSDTESGSDEEEDVPIPIAKENGKPSAKAPAAQPKVENKPKPEEKDDSDEDDSSEDDESDEEDDAEMMMGSDSDGDVDSDDESEDSEDEKPAIVADGSKKRPIADAKTPQTKKAKIATPSKSDSKKDKGVVHPATPHPKKDGNTPAGNKSDSKKGTPHQATPHPKKGDKTPKSGGSDVSCGECKKTFKSEVALQSHSKDKHAAK